jgi:hypothetical protein
LLFARDLGQRFGQFHPYSPVAACCGMILFAQGPKYS